MFVTKKHLSRRTFLRGAFGTVVALPMLDAMVPALAAQEQRAVASQSRFGAIYWPNGVLPERWHPTTVGRDFEFTQPMNPLAPYRDQVVVVSGMTATGNSHIGASSAWLNGVGPIGRRGEELESGKTLDQFIADAIGHDTPFPSIELGTEDTGTTSGECDGFACIYFNTLAWRDKSTPLPFVINPRVTFERMFGETGSVEQRAARLRQKQSMLDAVAEEAARLQGDLGPGDRAILDEYLSNVRLVERQLQQIEARADSSVDVPAAPAGIPETIDEHLDITYDLMHLAFQGDITRVFTFSTGIEASNRSYGHIGVPESHHNVSHHGGDPETQEKYTKIVLYEMSKLAQFVEKLRQTPDGDGTLLDHTLLYAGSGMSNGNQHDKDNPPAILIGGANGRLKGNRHVAAEPDRVLTPNLLLGIAEVMNVEVDVIGPSTGRISL